jgi:hypothetical protein
MTLQEYLTTQPKVDGLPFEIEFGHIGRVQESWRNIL